MGNPKRRPGPAAAPDERLIVERVQTGVRLEKRLLKVLKALAEYHDLSLGELLEGIVLHAFDGKCPFGEDTLRRIAELKRIYDLELDSATSHRLAEVDDIGRPALSGRRRGGPGRAAEGTTS
jgi:hypothetical protein